MLPGRASTRDPINMSDVRTIVYEFAFADGTVAVIPVRLAIPGFAMIHPKPLDPPPSWAQLGFKKCPNCPLHPDEHPHCPPAVNLSGLLDRFFVRTSTEVVDVTVTVNDRAIRKRCALQEGLSSLVGLVMASSGCPILDHLRPMVDSHLPFADGHETTYRAVSTYLVAQFIRSRAGLPADWTLDGLARMYGDVHIVNNAFVARFKSMRLKDASINAVVRLDALADIISFTLSHDWWEEIDSLFETYTTPAGANASVAP